MVEFSYKSRHKKHPHPHPQRNAVLNRQHPNPATSPTASSTNRKVCFSFAAYACTVISHLSKCNVPIARGLSDEEFQQIQARFGFDFPPDLRSILQEGLPSGAGFPNWRSSPPKKLLNMINLPAKGLCNEVLRGRFWCKHWGERPHSSEDAVRIAKHAFKTAPVLVPIYSHCYIPCFPNLSGNPIFFIFQKDVFYCGYDLADFFGREVFAPVGSLFEGSERLAYPEEIVLKSNQATQVSGREKRKNVRIMEEEKTVMESKLRAAYNKINGGHHQSIKDSHEVHYQSQSQLSQHPSSHQYRHSHRRSDKEVKWDALNKRLLAELQNAEAKDETLSRKSLCEERLHCMDRPPKSLVRSAGNSPRMGQNIMSRYVYFNDKPLPAKVLEQFTIAAPAWAGKMARHIPVWSDLVENKESVCTVNAQCASDTFTARWPEHVKNGSIMKQETGGKSQEKNPFDVLGRVFQSNNVRASQSNGSSYVWSVAPRKGVTSCDVALVGQSKESHSVALHDVPRQQEFEFDKKSSECTAPKQGIKPNRRWLVPYFKDMEETLRRGGWKHGEIEEMIAAVPPDVQCFSLANARQGIHDILSSSADAMVLSLQKAGWSEPDVVKILRL